MIVDINKPETYWNFETKLFWISCISIEGESLENYEWEIIAEVVIKFIELIELFEYHPGMIKNMSQSHMGRINQEWKNDPLGSLYSELWQLSTI